MSLSAFDRNRHFCAGSNPSCALAALCISARRRCALHKRFMSHPCLVAEHMKWPAASNRSGPEGQVGSHGKVVGVSTRLPMQK